MKQNILSFHHLFPIPPLDLSFNSFHDAYSAFHINFSSIPQHLPASPTFLSDLLLTPTHKSKFINIHFTTTQIDIFNQLCSAYRTLYNHVLHYINSHLDFNDLIYLKHNKISFFNFKSAISKVKKDNSGKDSFDKFPFVV